MNKLFKYLVKPQAYERSVDQLWNDEHISKGLLEAHLDPDFDAASRTVKFIDQSVEWIINLVPATKYQKLLDLGCGPGLYTNRLVKKGYQVTGIDFSERSINYAKNQAMQDNLNIDYILQNYLEIDYHNQFSVILLIFFDYGALIDKDRIILLQKIYQGLEDGGKFIFDVCTPKKYHGIPESNTWEYASEGGFWTTKPHLCLESHFIYDDNLRLNQHTIIDNDENIKQIRVWEQPFTKEMIITELKQAGFTKFSFYADVSGKTYDEESETLCVVTEK